MAGLSLLVGILPVILALSPGPARLVAG